MKDEIRIYLDPFSLLVVGPKGVTRKFTPITVICNKDFENLKRGHKYIVQKVLHGNQNKLLFEVAGKPFLHSNFLIP